MPAATKSYSTVESRCTPQFHFPIEHLKCARFIVARLGNSMPSMICTLQGKQGGLGRFDVLDSGIEGQSMSLHSHVSDVFF